MCNQSTRLIQRVLFAVLALLMTGLAAAAERDDFGYANTASGLPYRYFVPPSYNPAQRYPLILFLHGKGERGSDNEAQLNNDANGAMYLLDEANLAEQPVFMAAPQCPDSVGSWTSSMLTRAVGIIDELAAQYPIDLDRVYITGLSMGGIGTWNAVKTWPSRFAAAVPMSGNGSTSFPSQVAGIPFWFFHAANDGTVNVSGSDNLVKALRSAGARTIYTRYASGGHGIWSQAYSTPMLFHWLMSQRRGSQSSTAPPVLRITAPAAGSYFTEAAAISLAGTADNGANAISSISWQRYGGNSGNANGSTSWSTGGIPLASGINRINVQASGPSYFPQYGGETTFNDSLRVTRSVVEIFADRFAAQ